MVAPRAGAWIEISGIYKARRYYKSHPARVRGLKFYVGIDIEICIVSHPARVRGLKLKDAPKSTEKDRSHPARVRGLKCLIHGRR